MKIVPATPEFSRPLTVDKIPAGGVERELKANEAERRLLAKRFGLQDLPTLQATLKIRVSHAGQAVDVTGTMMADVVQQCVVTLEPLPAHIDVAIDVRYVAGEGEVGGSTLIAADEENVEVLTDGVIDLGELVAQHLGTALDPWPRKANLPPVEAEYGSKPSAEVISPFARLAEIKKPKD